MSKPSPEFSRLVPLARLGPEPFRQEIEATPDERAGLARRFDLVALDRLTAAVTLGRRSGETVLLEAAFAAAFVQTCAVTLEPVSATVSEHFSLVYGPMDDAAGEIEPGPEEPAFEPLTGDAIDIGEAVAQELSLALPLFPRHPDAELETAVEEPAGTQFSALARLRKPIAG